jgi:SAM-dependent methyltransferase
LHDRSDEGGATKSEYFWQDLLVARLIYAANPIKHVDIGSRWDGFVGHVASFRQLEVFDVRPVSTSIPGVIFRQADLMNPVTDMIKCSDSVSCLHTLEHLGLGRYGDTIDVAGSENGFKNIASLLKEDGTLYLSVPVGQERVEFNANRVFDPRTIIRWATNLSLVLSSLIVIRNGHQIETVEHPEAKLAALAQEQYALGLFVFRKV